MTLVVTGHISTTVTDTCDSVIFRFFPTCAHRTEKENLTFNPENNKLCMVKEAFGQWIYRYSSLLFPSRNDDAGIKEMVKGKNVSN